MSEINKHIRTSYILRRDITDHDIHSMFGIFIKYYKDTDIETFRKDLNKKDGALITRRHDNNDIVGFSTVVIMAFYRDGKHGSREKAYAIFSGDTIMEKEYWGCSSLHLAAAKYAIIQKIKNLRTPVYWFLISMSYKTYLTMANNLKDYWPRYDKENDPEGDNIIRTLCQAFFPDNYDETSGLLYFGEKAQKIQREHVEITDEMRTNFPKIAFFERKNPTWWSGTEVPCAAKLNLFNIFYGSLRQVIKFVKHKIQPVMQALPLSARSS